MSSTEYLGCNIETFKKHIGQQFTEDMSWENDGEWHIDHKTPLKYNKPSLEEGTYMKLYSIKNIQKRLTHYKLGCGGELFLNGLHKIRMMDYINKPHTALSIGQTGCGKTHLDLELIEKEYNKNFDCPVPQDQMILIFMVLVYLLSLPLVFVYFLDVTLSSLKNSSMKNKINHHNEFMSLKNLYNK